MIPWATISACRYLTWSVNYQRRALHVLPRLCSQPTTTGSFVPLDHLVNRRRDEAQRSLLVEVAGIESAVDLHQVCSQYGTVHKMFHYVLQCGHNNKEMILVEFKELSSLKQALHFTCLNSAKDVLPTHSPFVCLSAGESSGGAISAQTFKNITDLVTSNTTYSREELKQHISECSDISEQIQKLYDSQKLTELDWRLRFFTCRQIEVALSGLFPRATVLPFGSSINSFGNINCDLDMILELSGFSAQENSHRLIFQAKKSLASANSRVALQRRMELISGILDSFVPGCSQVRKILNARVPIIKYHQDLTDIECDLSMSNRSGFYMSHMLYMYGSMDPRVRPLVFAVRRWARDRHITSPFSGRWITNFSVTIMVLFYLMNVSPPVIPSLQLLKVNSGPDDDDESCVRFNFPTNLGKVVTSQNRESLETLLKGFFEFYDNFNFRELGLSVLHGRSFIKPVHSALYIQNPLEGELNVSRNVTLEEVEKLRAELTHARFLLESSAHNIDDAASNEVWGALSLWPETATSSGPSHIIQGSSNYPIDWKEVFHTENKKLIQSTNTKKSSLKGNSAGNQQKENNNGNTVFLKAGSVSNKGMGARGTTKLDNLVSKLKQKTTQREHIPHRNKFMYKGKYK
nr:poly(A) RNA polymerase, mitochondrial-like [Cherax quadricarinatus]